ncbi:phytanoyl-CoA dioxygenase [Aureococcus anophagefferens]|nr:phytanoyl-CoA dioxygenase [Aureococcus anophagefferens]
MEMAQLPGRWDGHRAYVSRVLCGQDCGEAAAPGGLLDAAAELATACLPYLDRVHVDFCLSEKGTAAFVAHTVPEPGAVGDDAEEVVLGGACARRAAPALFQVSFICVEPESKGRHMGAHLLKRLFSHARKYKVSHVATYADHGAVGFFLKHGFAKVSAADFPPGLYDRLDHYSERRAAVAEEPEFDLDDVIDAAVLAAPGASAPGAARAAPDWAEPAGGAEAAAWAAPPDRAEAAPAWPEKPDRAEAEPAWPEKPNRAEAEPAWPEKPNALLALRDTPPGPGRGAVDARRRAAAPRAVAAAGARRRARGPGTQKTKMAEVDDKEEEPRAKRARVEKDDEASADAPAAAAKDDGLAVKAFSGGFGAAAAGDDGLAVKAFSGGFGGTARASGRGRGAGAGLRGFGGGGAPAAFDGAGFGAPEKAADGEPSPPPGGDDAGDDPANVSNGEESERCVAKHRAKLFVLEKGDDRPAWKDRGVGALKVLEAAPLADEAVAKKRGLDGSVRVVMRREQIHSLMLNVKVGKPPHATVAKHGETALRIAAMTSATETATYLIRVKTAEERDGLFDALGGEAAPDE